MGWTPEYLNAAADDLLALDRSQQIQVIKAIRKVSQNPLPVSEGGYGKPLGSRQLSNLTGYLKIKLKKLGIRVVYALVREAEKMRIIVISVRADEEVYRTAEKRIKGQ